MPRHIQLSSIFRGHVCLPCIASSRPQNPARELCRGTLRPARYYASLTCDSPAIFLPSSYNTITTYLSTTLQTPQKQHHHRRVPCIHHGSPSNSTQRRLSRRRRLQMGRREERCAARKLSRPLAHGPCRTLAKGQRSELVCQGRRCAQDARGDCSGRAREEEGGVAESEGS